jgi:hypothetical protein
MRRHHASLILITALAILSAGASAQNVEPSELGDLVKGRKWLVALQGDLSNPGTSAYWDFRADGSMCVRFAGAKPNERCADEGRWNLDGQTLCWDLKYVGEQYGYKSACVKVEKTGPREYQMHNVKGFRQFPFRPVN